MFAPERCREGSGRTDSVRRNDELRPGRFPGPVPSRGPRRLAGCRTVPRFPDGCLGSGAAAESGRPATVALSDRARRR